MRPLEPVADPLPQALVLTAIVIAFGVLAFTLVLFRRAAKTTGVDNLDEMRTADHPTRHEHQKKLLPLIWMALTGSFSVGNFLLGLVIGSLALWIVHPARESVPLVVYLRKAFLWMRFIGFFLTELLLASLRVAFDVLTPRHHMRPAVLAIPLDLETDLGITFFANVITLTPGTLSLDISDDRKTLYIHAMYVDDVRQFKHKLKTRLERRIKELLN